ncbi:hypothetical protein Esti_004015 [Eimeria stiedai]
MPKWVASVAASESKGEKKDTEPLLSLLLLQQQQKAVQSLLGQQQQLQLQQQQLQQQQQQPRAVRPGSSSTINSKGSNSSSKSSSVSSTSHKISGSSSSSNTPEQHLVLLGHQHAPLSSLRLAALSNTAAALAATAATALKRTATPAAAAAADVRSSDPSPRGRQSGSTSSSSSSGKMPLRGLLCLLGGILLQMALGTIYTFGVSSVYFISFLKNHTDPSLRLAAGASLVAAEFSAMALSMPLGGLLEKKCGPRVGGLIGGLNFVAGVFLSKFSITRGFFWFVLTYAVLYGVGLGIAYPSPLVAALRWFPSHQAAVCINFFCLGGNFSLFPASTAAVFGRGAVGHVYGFVFMAQLGSSALTALAVPTLTQHLGLSGACRLTALCCFAVSALLCLARGTKVWAPFAQQQLQQKQQLPLA